MTTTTTHDHIVTATLVPFNDIAADDDVHVAAAFDQFWDIYNPGPDQEEFKRACLKLFRTKVHDEGFDPDDIVRGARIAAEKGWVNRYPWCWLNEHRWVTLIKQFGDEKGSQE